MRIVVYGNTNIGRVRKNNQDSIYVSSEHGLVVVADGIDVVGIPLEYSQHAI